MGMQLQTLEEIRRAGLDALANELGPVGMVRFLQQYETGHGNYSVDRRTWLGDQDVKNLVDQIRQNRHESSNS